MRVLLCSLAALVAWPAVAGAADTWTGRAFTLSASDGWAAPANWVGGDVPSGSVGQIVFPELADCPRSIGLVLVPVCYDVLDDGGAVSANAISIDGGYAITPASTSDELAIGAGGLSVIESTGSTNAAVIGVPVSLTATESWSLGPGALSLTGGLSGPPSDPLTIAVSAGTLDLEGTNEAGPVSVSASGSPGPSGLVELRGSDLNGSDGEPVAISGTTLAAVDANNSTGPLAISDGTLDLGAEYDVAELTVSGPVTFDPDSALDLSIGPPGAAAGTDYSELDADGSVDLDGATLNLEEDNGPGAPSCAAATSGQTLTLISSTGGTISGQFAGIPDGATIAFTYPCGGGELPTLLTINYTSTSVTATVNLPPTVTVSPTLSGTAVQGEPVSVTSGAWSNGPVTYAYAWETCVDDACTAIPGATGASYTPTGDDVGETLEAVVTATGPLGLQGSADATEPGPVEPASPTETAAPTISGTALEGDTLTEAHAAWVFPPDAYDYQWLRCLPDGFGCTPIASANGQTYALTGADVGSTIEVQEIAVKGTIDTTAATSVATAVVMPVTPANLAPPTISGNPVVGDTLTELHGTWVFPPRSYAYQWYDCDPTGTYCLPIPGATDPTYAVTSFDYGLTIRVTEQATTNAVSETAVSAPTAVVTSFVPVNLVPPSISGTPEVGQTLTETTGTWSGDPTGYLYAWLDCNPQLTACSEIDGADGNSYTLTDADAGSVIVAGVLAVNAYGYGDPGISDPTAVVTYAPPTASPVPAAPAPTPPAGTTTTVTTTAATKTTPTSTSPPPVTPVVVSAKTVDGALSHALVSLQHGLQHATRHTHRLPFSFTAPAAGGLKLDVSLKVGKKTELLATMKVSFKQAGSATKALELTARDDRLIGSRRRREFVIAGSFVPIGGPAASQTKTIHVG